ncbi:peptide chain release factor N(5)-glutamine methyltransferase [Dyella caseinilytica]|uniref:Release factor glutamine methyltransferase n=1 Tax=Dyella caseinilytica TaxID=1849581 RepID=A0ABX7GVY3_9GAMM|nr:peptide chain release factor N(5)-glutamine methyltransferase [Dyella caseinilytica]QRN54449.1 peptide chain release factor N(5)-glutamine methyltransferase [Dyella caseinilytica]GFZ94330.1 release factor glutamine methyltransferase [Dyella caseinilytica]
MLKVRQALLTAVQRLGDRVDAEVLLAYALSKSRSWLIAHADDLLSAEHASAYTVLVEQREAGEPVAYITGRRGFWSLDLEVTPDTLIPRPETELLVEEALERIPISKTVNVADLGTGTGAIALAIARDRPLAQVIATDASADALAVARRNASRHDILNVSFVQGDWFAPLGDQRFDVIVSNPPYIENHDPHLNQGDLRFEPMSALASGEDGLDDIRRIIRDAGRHLLPEGWLLFEHGWNQGEAVRMLLCNASFAKVSTMRDLEQRERMTMGCWSVSKDCGSS